MSHTYTLIISSNNIEQFNQIINNYKKTTDKSSHLNIFLVANGVELFIKYHSELQNVVESDNVHLHICATALVRRNTDDFTTYHSSLAQLCSLVSNSHYVSFNQPIFKACPKKIMFIFGEKWDELDIQSQSKLNHMANEFLEFSDMAMTFSSFEFDVDIFLVNKANYIVNKDYKHISQVASMNKQMASLKPIYDVNQILSIANPINEQQDVDVQNIEQYVDQILTTEEFDRVKNNDELVVTW